jgi:Domain of unknown function (DUF5753)
MGTGAVACPFSAGRRDGRSAVTAAAGFGCAEGPFAAVAGLEVFERDPAPEVSFVLEEWTLRRPLGGRAVLRCQLEQLLETGQLRNVELQVMPMDREEHAGVDGGIEVLKFNDGTAMGRSPVVASGRPVSDPRQLRILELRYGIIRAQALTPRESRAFIELLLGET